jgi:hypothetical protein
MENYWVDLWKLAQHLRHARPSDHADVKNLYIGAVAERDGGVRQ